MDLISIIVPVYNVEKYLDECVESILNQTYKNIELILVDDGSTDDSGEKCNTYKNRDKRVKVIHQENRGVSAARNNGLRLAQGDWVLFIDSDDMVDRNLLKICYKYFGSDKDIDICFFGFRELKSEEMTSTCFTLKPKIIDVNKTDFLGLQARIFNRDRQACCRNIIKLSSPCKFFRRKILIENNLFFDENLINGEDGLFNLYAYRYARRGICIEEPLYFYRIRSDSVTQRFSPNVENDFEKLHRKYRIFIREDNNKRFFKILYNERLIWSFSFFCILKYCHPDNKKSYRERKREFLEMHQKYKEQWGEHCSLKHFGLKKKLVLFFIKKRHFLMVDLLCKVERILQR